MNRPPRAATLRALVRVPALLIFDFLALVLMLMLMLWVAPRATASAAPTADRWSWPLDGSPAVVRGFGPPPEPWLAGHRGVDLMATPGAPVRAAGAGQVTFAGQVGGVPVVAVTHPDGRRTTYEPVVAVVARGEQVRLGATLGRLSAGGSHCLPLACLHWGLLRASTYLDPLSLVGADLRVRLLPVWSGSGSPTQLGPGVQPWRWFPTSRAAAPPTATPTAEPASLSVTSGAPRDPARLGALNRARAAPWDRW